jgi:hypothetical protein
VSNILRMVPILPSFLLFVASKKSCHPVSFNLTHGIWHVQYVFRHNHTMLSKNTNNGARGRGAPTPIRSVAHAQVKRRCGNVSASLLRAGCSYLPFSDWEEIRDALGVQQFGSGVGSLGYHPLLRNLERKRKMAPLTTRS